MRQRGAVRLYGLWLLLPESFKLSALKIYQIYFFSDFLDLIFWRYNFYVKRWKLSLCSFVTICWTIRIFYLLQVPTTCYRPFIFSKGQSIKRLLERLTSPNRKGSFSFSFMKYLSSYGSSHFIKDGQIAASTTEGKTPKTLLLYLPVTC